MRQRGSGLYVPSTPGNQLDWEHMRPDTLIAVSKGDLLTLLAQARAEGAAEAIANANKQLEPQGHVIDLMWNLEMLLNTISTAAISGDRQRLKQEHWIADIGGKHRLITEHIKASGRADWIGYLPKIDQTCDQCIAGLVELTKHDNIEPLRQWGAGLSPGTRQLALTPIIKGGKRGDVQRRIDEGVEKLRRKRGISIEKAAMAYHDELCDKADRTSEQQEELELMQSQADPIGATKRRLSRKKKRGTY